MELPFIIIEVLNQKLSGSRDQPRSGWSKVALRSSYNFCVKVVMIDADTDVCSRTDEDADLLSRFKG